MVSHLWSQGEDGAPAATFASGGGFEFGVDPNEDPELALVSSVEALFCTLETFVAVPACG